MRIAPALILAFVAACTPDVDLVGKLCDENGACPDGLTCEDGRCVPPEPSADAGGPNDDGGDGADQDGGALSGLDAGPADLGPGCVEDVRAPCEGPDRCGTTVQCDGTCGGGTEPPACECGDPVCLASGEWICTGGCCDPAAGQSCTRTGYCGSALDCDGECVGGTPAPACSCGNVTCQADGTWSECPDPANLGDLCENSGLCGGTIACDGSCQGGTAAPGCQCSTPVCQLDGEWSACTDPPSLGAFCGSAAGCGGTIACDGSCTGAGPCDSPPGQCSEWSGNCDLATGACLYGPKAQGEPCDDGDLCTYDDACDGNASCSGTTVACVDDACVDRSCNGTSSCTETPLGTQIYEVDANGWDYNASGNGTYVFRTPVETETLYILESPAISDKLLSSNPNESNDCNWCGCVTNCAFTNTGRTIGVSATQQAGMVPLYRYVMTSPSIRHRGALASPGSGWNQEATLGYVCAP